MFRSILRTISSLLVAAMVATALSTAANAQPSEPSPKSHDRTQAEAYGPAPDWFKDPTLEPLTPMPKAAPIKVQGGTERTEEVFLEQGYCRNVYGQYYWMANGANPASCTQGYVKYYDSRNSSYLGAIDVYMLYWNMTRSTAVTTAYNWCTSNFVCNALLGSLVVSKIGAAWKLIRAIRWGL